MAEFEKILLSALTFAFLVFLFPQMYQAILSSGTTSSAKPLLLGIPVILIIISGGSMVYFALKGR